MFAAMNLAAYSSGGITEKFWPCWMSDFAMNSALHLEWYESVDHTHEQHLLLLRLAGGGVAAAEHATLMLGEDRAQLICCARRCPAS